MHKVLVRGTCLSKINKIAFAFQDLPSEPQIRKQSHTVERVENLLCVTQESELGQWGSGSHWFFCRMGERLSFKLMIGIAVCREFSWAEPDWWLLEAGRKERRGRCPCGLAFGPPFSIPCVFLLIWIFTSHSAAKTSPSSLPIWTSFSYFVSTVFQETFHNSRMYVS